MSGDKRKMKKKSIRRSMCGYFYGYKVFCDDTLKFGEVEIR